MRNQTNEVLRNRIVSVKKQVLLDTLLKNKTQHELDYSEALVAFKDAMIRKLRESEESVVNHVHEIIDKLCDLVEENKDPNDFTTQAQKIGVNHYDNTFAIVERQVVKLPIPVSYKDAYQQAYDLIAIDTREDIEIDYQFYRCAILNEWDWTEDFAQKTLSYKA